MDDKDNPVVASTATACWTTVLHRVSKERSKLGLGKTGTAVSGPEFFGFAMPEIAACIEGLDGAELCKQYIPRCLRMDNPRRSRPRAGRSRPSQVNEMSPVDEESGTNGRPSKRRAAQAASQKWQKMEEIANVDMTDNDMEESISDIESDSTDESSYRKSQKRREKEEQNKNTGSEDEKRIRTEELCYNCL